MMPRFQNLLLLLVLASFWASGAQNIQNANWVFGEDNLLGVPEQGGNTTASSIITPLFSTGEGCASVSDEAGNLMMYSDGSRLWFDAGTGIGPVLVTSGLRGNGSSAQNVIFVPDPASDTSYYIFCVDGSTGSSFGTSYSRIDFSGTPTMSVLNEPLLDSQGDPIFDVGTIHFSEAITSSLSSDGESYWVIATSHLDGQTELRVLSYLVTVDGIEDINGVPNMPWQSTSVTISDVGWSAMSVKISRDGKRIAMITGIEGVHLGSFDNTTGEIVFGSTIPIAVTELGYGLEFSPNSNALYYTTDGDFNIYRVDLQTMTQTDVFSSLSFYGTIQIGRDDRMYINGPESITDEISVIEDPDNAALITLEPLPLL